MKEYHLADTTENNGELTVNARLKLSEEKYKEIRSWFDFASYFHVCRSMKKMTIESCLDLQRYIVYLQNKTDGYDDLEIDEFLITSNRLLISFLSFIKTFIDVLSNTISKRNPEKLQEFKKFNSKLYDDYFGYRFLNRMRNYVIHFDMPLTTVTDSVNTGVTVCCSRDSLLRYNGWNSVKQEIEKLPESIDIIPYINEAEAAIIALYLKSLEFIVEDVVDANHKTAELCKKNGVLAPIIVIIDTETKHPSFEKLPIYLMVDFVNEINQHPNYNIEMTNMTISEE